MKGLDLDLLLIFLAHQKDQACGEIGRGCDKRGKGVQKKIFCMLKGGGVN